MKKNNIIREQCANLDKFKAEIPPNDPDISDTFNQLENFCENFKIRERQRITPFTRLYISKDRAKTMNDQFVLESRANTLETLSTVFAYIAYGMSFALAAFFQTLLSTWIMEMIMLFEYIGEPYISILNFTIQFIIFFFFIIIILFISNKVKMRQTDYIMAHRINQFVNNQKFDDIIDVHDIASI